MRCIQTVKCSYFTFSPNSEELLNFGFRRKLLSWLWKAVQIYSWWALLSSLCLLELQTAYDYDPLRHFVMDSTGGKGNWTVYKIYPVLISSKQELCIQSSFFSAAWRWSPTGLLLFTFTLYCAHSLDMRFVCYSNIGISICLSWMMQFS